MKKVIILGIIGAFATAALVAAVVYRPVISPAPDTTNTTNTQPATDDRDTDTSAAATGRYVEYEQSQLAAEGYQETILFFHAPWCPECRAFEQAITSGDIPDGVQVLKVDYDSSSELKKKYGVTLQTTFVKVNAAGEKVSSWVGYGKEKSLAIVLENT